MLCERHRLDINLLDLRVDENCKLSTRQRIKYDKWPNEKIEEDERKKREEKKTKQNSVDGIQTTSDKRRNRLPWHLT